MLEEFFDLDYVIWRLLSVGIEFKADDDEKNVNKISKMAECYWKV